MVKLFARRLRQHRQAAALTQAALAKKARIARPYLTQLEGATKEPSIVTVAKLAKALGIKPGALLE
jgi:transcriptional regulator with XRE-family HTH domain